MIFFLGINSSYSHFATSYGLIRSYTEKKVPEWKWKYIEGTVNDDEDTVLDSVINLIDSENRTGELLTDTPVIITTFYLFNHEFNIRLLKKLKAIVPECVIISGGPQFLGDNEGFLRETPEIDVVVRGDESSFHLLLSLLNRPEKWSEIPGVCYIGKDGVYYDAGKAKYDGELDNLPSMFEMGIFPEGKPFCQLETSRGCSGVCSFCTSALTGKVTNFSLERIKDDLKILQRRGIHEIRVLDRNFNEDTQRTLDLLNIFYRDFPDMRFHLEINPYKVDDDILKMFKDAPSNMLHLEVGIQTLNPECLRAVRRPADAEKCFSRLTALCGLVNVEVHADLIAGLPNQYPEDVIRDVKLIVNAAPNEIQLEILKVLPGTPFVENHRGDCVWNPVPPYSILKTRTMSFAHILSTRYLSKIIDGYYNAAALRPAFRFALKHDDDFISVFLEYIEKNSTLNTPYSMEKRFVFFENFAEKSADENLKELVKFSWLINGFSPRKYGLKSRRLQGVEVEMESVIWQDGDVESPAAKRYFFTEFLFNAGAIWLNPDTEIIHEKHTYMFWLATGNRIFRVCRLKNGVQ